MASLSAVLTRPALRGATSLRPTSARKRTRRMKPVDTAIHGTSPILYKQDKLDHRWLNHCFQVRQFQLVQKMVNQWYVLTFYGFTRKMGYYSYYNKCLVVILLSKMVSHGQLTMADHSTDLQKNHSEGEMVGGQTGLSSYNLFCQHTNSFFL